MRKAKPSNNKTGKERGIGVVLEHIESKVDLLAEGQHGLQMQIDGLDKKIDEKVDGLRDEINYKFEVAFDELHLIRNDLKEKVGRDEFVALEKRVVHLEKSLPRR